MAENTHDYGRTICFALPLALLLSCSFPHRSMDGGCPMPLPMVTAEIDGNELVLEVAASQEARECGLSGHEQLAADRGMLFVYLQPGPLSFWMKDTKLPLSIAFIDDTRRIIAIEQMEPMRAEPIYRSPQPARYGLEVNRGWFAKHHVAIGDTVQFTLPPELVIE